MKIVFFGSSDFSIPVLKSLQSAHDLYVITTPDKGKGRGRQLSPTVVKEYAIKENIPHSEPEKLSAPVVLEAIKNFDPDLIVIASYGKLVPSSIFSLPKLAALNIHPSLLPKYRGASPIQAAILNGEKKTGVSIAEVTKDLDAGDLFAQIETEIGENENAGELSVRLSVLAYSLLLDVIRQLQTGTVAKTAQNHSLSSYAKKIEKEEGKIDWNKSAWQIHNEIRGYFPWPSAYTLYRSKRLKIVQSALSKIPVSGNPGTIAQISKEGILVNAGSGSIEFKKVQPEGRKEMSAFEFAIGQRIQKGDPFHL